jgi:hypothetical protein
MKVRLGFVSNSSSSSFCIYKKLMSEEQIEEFKKIISEVYKEVNRVETDIGEIGDYFIGNMSIHTTLITDYLGKNFAKNEYAILSE